MKLTPSTVLLFFLLSSLHACSGEASGLRGTRGKVVDSSSGTVALGIDSARAYRLVALPATGSIGGSITMQGAPADSVVRVTRVPRVCGESASVTQTRASGGALGNVLVWVEGMGTGKPLPELRRETLSIERCQFAPRLMAVASGTTINVLSLDHATHTSRFYREGAGEPVDEIHTVDAGQVVPSEKIAREAGFVEVRRTEDPWARAYIAVFDHPYFAVTDERGTFRIDSLPPGTYTVKVWHERMAKPVEQRVVVAAGGSSKVDASLTLP